MNPARDITITNRLKNPGSALNECNVHFNNALAYIAHYAIQSEETYRKRKIELPTDHTGVYRGQPNSAEIHQSHNSTENLIPKIKYANRVRRFLQHYDPEHYDPEHYDPEHYDPEHYDPEHYDPEHYDPNIAKEPEPEQEIETETEQEIETEEEIETEQEIEPENVIEI
jgi:hypothetical protein